MAFKKQSYTDKDNPRISVVEPIRKKAHIKGIINWFYEHDLEKYAILFKLGCYTGLRASDLLSFKKKDLYNRTRVILREQKTGKVKTFPLQMHLQILINTFIEKQNLTDEEYVFSGRYTNKEVDRSQVYRFIVQACKELGIEDNVGTHTMRKTFGYHAYKQFNNVVVLQFIFNHSGPDVTKRYIGITQDEMDEVYLKLDLENDDMDDMMDMAALAGSNKTRNKRIIEFCKIYIKATNDKGLHVPFAKMILDIARCNLPYKWLDKKTGKYRS